MGGAAAARERARRRVLTTRDRSIDRDDRDRSMNDATRRAARCGHRGIFVPTLRVQNERMPLLLLEPSDATRRRRHSSARALGRRAGWRRVLPSAAAARTARPRARTTTTTTTTTRASPPRRVFGTSSPASRRDRRCDARESSWTRAPRCPRRRRTPPCSGAGTSAEEARERATPPRGAGRGEEAEAEAEEDSSAAKMARGVVTTMTRREASARTTTTTGRGRSRRRARARPSPRRRPRFDACAPATRTTRATRRGTTRQIQLSSTRWLCTAVQTTPDSRRFWPTSGRSSG